MKHRLRNASTADEIKRTVAVFSSPSARRNIVKRMLQEQG